MKHLRVILIFVSLGLSNQLQSQNRNFWEQMIDSIRYYKANEKPAFMLGFDNKVTFLGSNAVKVNGLRIGVNYQKFSYFLGLYGSRNDIYKQRLINQSQFIPDTQLQVLRFNYISLGFTYSNWASKHWYFETTGQFGIGNGQRETYENSTFIKKDNVPILPLEINGKAYYMFTNWIGLGAGLGVRKAVLTSSQFDGLFYTTSLKFYIGRFYRQVIRKNAKSEKSEK